jgi:hypothetical protein
MTIIANAQTMPMRKYTDIAPATISKLILCLRIMLEKMMTVTNPKKKNGRIIDV